MSAAANLRVRVRSKAVWGARVRVGVAVALALSTTSCGEALRQSQSASYLIINALEGASGADPTKFGGTMFSDVITLVKDAENQLVPTIFSDPARVRFSLGLKDVGQPDAATKPTTNNYITIDRYRVTYIRADGRNTPGVDVPYAFDGGMTLTVGNSEVTGGFEIVRNNAKVEPPLAALVTNGVIINAIAEVTFYGHDQTGREVSVTGKILVDFGNFGDPR
jgi:hypothetical protein